MERQHPPAPMERDDGRSSGRLLPLTEALSREVTKTPSKTKTRSLSDSAPALSPSPRFKEPIRKASDDINAVLSTPSRFSRTLDLSSTGLTLQMPQRDTTNFFNPPGVPTPGGYPAQIDARDAYGSPSMLPRHSRGLDFSRAATHLHHSTIAEQSSPESSPTITQKTLMSRRPSSHSMMLDSPRFGSGWMMGGNLGNDRPYISRSVGSTTAMMSESSSSDSDGDNLMQEITKEDVMVATPQVSRFEGNNAVTPYGLPRTTSLNSWMEGQSPGPIPYAFTNIRHGRKPRDRGRHSSDSADSRSRRTTPDPQSNRDSTMSSYVGRDTIMQTPASRRESLSLGTNHLHITSSNEEADESGSSGPHANPAVIRRPVTRRSNLLPKTKGFARIRAALQEENTPVDSEAKREAEVVKQVNANYQGHDWGTATTAPPSPDLIPTIPGMHRESSSMSDIDGLGLDYGANFVSKSGPEQRRGSTQKEFWANMLNRMQTPPPQFGNRPRSSSGVSDVGTESPQVSTPPSTSTIAGPAQSMTAMSAPDAVGTTGQISSLPSTAELNRKVGKRRRDDDFDVYAIKRRAVSPGLSIQSSPVAGQSPVSSSSGWWGQQKPARELSNSGIGPDERPGSISQGPSNAGPKRVGLQGMTDTSDGLMKMSIE